MELSESTITSQTKKRGPQYYNGWLVNHIYFIGGISKANNISNL